MKTYLIPAILLLTSSGLFAQKEIQKGDMNIHIKVDDNWDQTTFIDISKKSEKVIISSPKRIRLRKDELDKDTAFLNPRKNGSKYAIAEYKQKFKNFIDQHSTFDTTTVVVNLKTDHQYEEILKLIAATSKAKLEKSHEIRDLLMDASDFTFTISTDSSTKNVYAKGLFKERYPMLSNLMTLTYTRLESTPTK